MTQTMTRMIEIDGSRGEGGGQVLRTALALSLATGTPFRIAGIRGGRAKSGLLRQHLTCVRAADALSDARVEGGELRSTELTFAPQALRGGSHAFAVGMAGSALLVLQSVLPALLTGPEPAELTIEGGTHNPAAPPWEFVERSWLPLLRRMGARVEARIGRRGFMPAGGGRIVVRVTPVARLAPLHMPERSPVSRLYAEAIFNGLGDDIPQRMLDAAGERLGLAPEDRLLRKVKSPGGGGALAITAQMETHAEVATAFARKGVAAEGVAKEAATQMRRFLDRPGSVGRYLADQLLLPMALAGGGSFTTRRPTPHTMTNIQTIRAFLDIPVTVQAGAEEGAPHRIEIGD